MEYVDNSLDYSGVVGVVYYDCDGVDDDDE